MTPAGSAIKEQAVMPTYEYVCAKCDHHFEIIQPITDEPLGVCPKQFCGLRKWGKGKVKRVIGAGGGLLFKGSGFYITDYRSDKYKEAAKKESAAGAAGDAKAGANKADSKPPAKSGGKPAPPAAKS